MGRRRRKREVRIVKKRIPRIFNCPSCGSQSILVKIDKASKKSRVTCGSCSVEWITEAKDYEEAVDIYSRFVDAYLSGELG